jgi:hypothetical protein
MDPVLVCALIFIHWKTDICDWFYQMFNIVVVSPGDDRCLIKSNLVVKLKNNRAKIKRKA